MYSHRQDRRSARPTRPTLPTLLRALGLVRNYRHLLLFYLGTVALTSLAGLGQPLLIKELIDNAIPNRDAAYLNLLILGMVALILLGAVNSTAQSWLSSSVAHNVMFDL